MIQKENLYKLPYTKDNNPNAFIEPTSFCQLRCPYCYRGTNSGGYKPVHRQIGELKKEIDELLKLRKMQTLSIGGGEPLMYPELDELIKYAKSKNLNIVIFSNGLLLDKKRLVELKNLGVARIVLHIGQYQGRKGLTKEDEILEEKRKFCNLFREVRETTLGFINYLSNENLQHLNSLADFYKGNSDVIKTVVFTILRKRVVEGEGYSEDELEANSLFEKVKEVFGLDYCAYLDKTESDEISWLFSFIIYKDQNIIGCLKGRDVRLYQEDHFKKFGRYNYVSNQNDLSLKMLFHFFGNMHYWKIAFRFLFSRGKLNLNEQFLLIMNPPVKKNGKWSFCDGCPDAMLYNGGLIPECLLERVKEGEKIKIG